MDRSKQLGEVKISKLLLNFSIPAIVGMLVNAIYNLVDRIYIGHGVGALGIGAITVIFPIMLIMMGFSMLIGVGANALVSIKLGEKKNDEAEQIFGNAFVLLLCIPICITIVGHLFLNQILVILGASENIFPYAQSYLSIILMGAVFQTIGMGMNNFIRAEGNPKMAMVTMLIGALMNTILDPIFIFAFNWGISGAALATIISQGISAAWVLYYFFNGKSLLRIRRKNLRLKSSIILRIVSIGVAPFSMQMAASLLNLIMNNSLGFYGGDIAISGMGVVNSILTLIMMPLFGINQGAQPIIGYNYGAKQFDRVKETLKLAITAATTIVVVGFIATRLIPTQLVSMFNSKDTELIAFGTHALKVFLVFLPIIGFQIISANYFQAVGKPKQAAFLSLSRQILILIPALLILPRFFGLDGVLYSGPLADLVSSIVTGTFLYFEMKKLNLQHTHSLTDDKSDLDDDVLKDPS